ncbi:MAG TPA: CehA/McbA family metallohydrolase [Candidatus Dormibacteraeota bacterium]|nr:CehA/McbA family metallohydrolase [Candidatus Dormibacteraeota bacterium]
MTELKIDLHVHTVGSYDAHTKREDLPGIIKARGLDGVAVTEHNKFDPPKLAALTVPGIEISSREGHIIALGIQEMIQPRQSADDTIRQIRNQDGVVVIPHPYDPVCECIKLSRLKTTPDAVETVNADALSFYISNWLARRDADKLKLPQVGGSDSHIPQTVGDAYTVIDANSPSTKDILEAIRAGRVRAEGHATTVRNKLRKLSYKFK